MYKILNCSFWVLLDICVFASPLICILKFWFRNCEYDVSEKLFCSHKFLPQIMGTPIVVVVQTRLNLWNLNTKWPHYLRKPIKDTNRENTPSNKTQVLTKSMNMDIWVNGTLNQLFIRGSYSEIHFEKLNSGKTPFSIGSFCNPHSISIGCHQGSFLWKCHVFNRSTNN